MASTVADEPPASAPAAGYARGATLLSIGLALTGLVTFAYFSLASYALDEVAYKHISLLWSVMFVICSVIYRPIEQLLARTLAARRARGLHDGDPLRTPLTIQGGFALAFLACALALRGPLTDDVFDGSSALYWVLVTGVLAYAASYFARGWLAGNQRFALYGGLVFLEATGRCTFALAALIGITSGQTAVAIGMAAAPFISLMVVPWAFSRRLSTPRARPSAHRPRTEGNQPAEARPAAPGPGPRRRERPAPEDDGLSLGRGGRFAVAVLGVMLAEQTLLNAAVLIVDASTSDKVIAGVVFNAFLIARAPLQLFQAVQGSLLPHLAGLEAREGTAEFHRAVRVTALAIAGFAGAIALGLIAIGPWAMGILFDNGGDYPRLGLALVAVGMGLHLIGGTLNQAALARDRAGAAALAWLTAAALFVGFLLTPAIDDLLWRAEAAYAGAAAVLSALLWLVYRRPAPARP